MILFYMIIMLFGFEVQKYTKILKPQEKMSDGTIILQRKTVM